MADLREHLPGLEPERRITDWGRSERTESLLDRALLEFLYHYWFRVRVEGTEHVPASGGALLVANRAGMVPFDGAMISRAVREEHSHGRTVHLATRQPMTGVPGLGPLLMKVGVVAAHPANLHRLLFDEGELVLAFPEGPGAGYKPMRERYRLRSFDQAGFMVAAAAAGVPVVPVAVLGSEEAVPVLARIGTRLPVVPPVPLPAKFHIRFLAPLDPGSLSPGGRTPAQLAERVRETIQESLRDMLDRRPSAWFSAPARHR